MQIIHGDALTRLKELPDQSVQMVCTSPPYYGLRDYQTARWIGGDTTCDHVSDRRWYTESTAAISSGGAFQQAGEANKERLKKGRWREHGNCIHCGAAYHDEQLGLEASPEQYVANLVAVLREVKRVLRDDGTLWLNLGDSYVTSSAGSRGTKSTLNGAQTSASYVERLETTHTMTLDKSKLGLPSKNLLLIPARVALALQADGWIVRSDIIWAKSSCMPESVRDRPTSSYEHVFLLAKQERYFYDGDAIRESYAEISHSRYKYEMRDVDPDRRKPGVRNRIPETRKFDMNELGRNSRNVWLINNNKRFKGAHFATMPLQLAERCILAGTSEKGCCAKCGAPWRRVKETVRQSSWQDRKACGHVSGIGSVSLQQQNGNTFDNRAGGFGDPKIERTIGWQATCSCNADVVPCTVLDPFGGAGTTAYAALRHNRDAITIELNQQYCQMIEERLAIVV